MLMLDSDESEVQRKKLEQEFEEVTRTEEQIEKELDVAVGEIKNLDGKFVNLSDVNENIFLLNSSTKQLTSILHSSSALSNKINLQIQELDLARSRVSECQKRVQDLLDLQLCSDGVQNALKSENYEQAAVHVHRFLAMDQQLLKQTADEMAQDCATVTQSLKLLRDAAAMLRNKISLHFKEAVSVTDAESVKRFFKLFPLLNMYDYGLENFSMFLRKMLKNIVTEKLNVVRNSSIRDKRNTIVFAEVITYLFEEIAKLITEHTPLVETYYGSGSLIRVVCVLQKECDALSESILNEFRSQRDVNSKLHVINELLRSGSSKTEHIDPRDIDMLLNEITTIHSRYGLYLRFIRSRIDEDLEDETPESNKSETVLAELESMISSSDISKQMQVLIGDYLLLERYYMEQSVKKAMQMDIYDKDALISSMVDDTFFIVKKCIRRGYASGNMDAVCAVINNVCAILETDVCNTLRQQLRQGYSAGYLDLTQAYNVMIQGRLQQMDSEQTRVLFLLYLNNCDVCGEYTTTLLSTLTNEILCPTKNDKDKLDSCLSGFTSVVGAFTTVREYGLQQLRSSVVKPRVVPWVDSFLSVSHQLNAEEFSSYDANEPFIRSLIINLESLLSEFKPRLTSTNYDSFILIIADEVIIQLEKDILKTEFNRMGGLILDKEIRTLVGYMSNATSWSIRERFSRLTQIALILNLEKLSEILEYWDSESTSFTWRLTPKEIRQFLNLRKDFRAEDIKRLKL